MVETSVAAARPSILAYLSNPALPAPLIERFFRAAIDYADGLPWSRLVPSAHFPILLRLRSHAETTRLAMILGGEESGGDAVGLVLVEELPDESVPGPPVHPAHTVLYAGYPDPDLSPLTWHGHPLPRTRSGLLAWPMVHDTDDRVRAPGHEDLVMITCGLVAVKAFLDSYPSRLLDDGDARPHEIEAEIHGLPGTPRVRASTFALPPG